MRTIAFVNCGSGGNEGQRVLDHLKHEIGDENVFDIKEDKGPDRGLETRAADPTEDTNIIVAGGDGTFSWVANAVEKKNLSHCRLIVIPLGSGNDMSRALGWGKKFPGLSNISHQIEWLKVAKRRKLDVWRLTAKHSDAMSTPVDEHGVAHGARPLVCNYLSLGADAFVELRFNQLRWKNPEKYKSRLGNLQAHFFVGSKYMCIPQSKKIHVADHIEKLTVDGKEIVVPDNLQALIFLNIPSYGAGTQPWGKPGRQRHADVSKEQIQDMYVDDRKFEVIGLRSLSQFGRIKVLGANGIRIAQGQSMSISLKSESTPFQVDGEPWEQRGGSVALEPGNRIGVLEGPVWRSTSRKNAKFDPSPRASIDKGATPYLQEAAGAMDG